MAEFASRSWTTNALAKVPVFFLAALAALYLTLVSH